MNHETITAIPEFSQAAGRRLRRFCGSRGRDQSTEKDYANQSISSNSYTSDFVIIKRKKTLMLGHPPDDRVSGKKEGT
jgi:hypothetical protein